MGGTGQKNRVCREVGGTNKKGIQCENQCHDDWDLGHRGAAGNLSI